MLTSEAREGMKRAEDHANRVDPNWSARADEFLRFYALRHSTFTAEQVLEHSRGLIPPPPDSRAWGAVFARARRAGLIALDGYEQAKRREVHSQIVRRWKSPLFWKV